MRDKADLCDKTDELEHMVLQLQGETETIGNISVSNITSHTICYGKHSYNLLSLTFIQFVIADIYTFCYR